ncbi:hypothetical protein EEDFHM_00248 [Methylorubrum populi]
MHPDASRGGLEKNPCQINAFYFTSAEAPGMSGRFVNVL